MIIAALGLLLVFTFKMMKAVGKRRGSRQH